MIDNIKRHWLASIFLTLVLVSFCTMYVTKTLSYPYILVERQIEMIKFCYFGSNQFKTSDYGFSITVPEKYCFLPNRLFPSDGSIHVLPKGLYSSINEYATGSVILNSKSTLLFEPIRDDRNITAVLKALKQGGFMADATTETVTNRNGVEVYILRNVKGIDDTKKYNWAFITHPNGNIFLSILLLNTNDASVFEYILENIKAE